jgi:hypothetical protein
VFGVEGSGYRVWGFEAWGLELGVWSLGFGVSEVWGLGIWAVDLGFGIQGLERYTYGLIVGINLERSVDRSATQ